MKILDTISGSMGQTILSKIRFCFTICIMIADEVLELHKHFEIFVPFMPSSRMKLINLSTWPGKSPVGFVLFV